MASVAVAQTYCTTIPIRLCERTQLLPQTCSAAALATSGARLSRRLSACDVALPARRCTTITARGKATVATALPPTAVARVPRPLALTSTTTLAPTTTTLAPPVLAGGVVGAATASVRFSVGAMPSQAPGSVRMRSTSPVVSRRKSKRRAGRGSALAAMGTMPVPFRAGNREARALRVLCYGDSLTVGFHDGGRQYEPYGKTMAEALSAAAGTAVEVLVCGHSGHTAQEMVADLDASTVEDVGGLLSKGLRRALTDASSLPDLVVIMTGTNDLGSGSKPNAVMEDITRLHGVCHALGVSTVAVAPPAAPKAPSGTSFEAARKALVELVKTWAQGSPLTKTAVNPADLVPATAGQGTWDPDRLHLGPQGSRLLGLKLAQLIAPILVQ